MIVADATARFRAFLLEMEVRASFLNNPDWTVLGNISHFVLFIN
jgi:hypothetical protein